MNNIYANTVVLTAEYQVLSDSRLVLSFVLTSPATNVNAVAVRFNARDTEVVTVLPGEWHEFKVTNLADIEVKGTANETVTIVGGSW